MAIITGTPTRHASEDRLDRITAIALTIGFGKVIKERQRDGKWYQITDTGVLVVRTPDKESIITIWAATQRQVADIYGEETIPGTLRYKMKANRKKFPETYEM